MTPRRILALSCATAALALSACGPESSGSSGSPDESPEDGNTVEPGTTVTQDAATYRVPEGFEEDDQGNVTHLIGSTEPEVWVEHEAEGAIVQWYVLPPEIAAGAEQEQIRGVIEAGLGNLEGSSSEELVAFRETEGLGCVADAELVGEPETLEVGEGYALRYEYTCTSMFGPQHSIAITAYGWDTRKHSLTVSASTDYWGEHEVELQASADSFRVTN